MSSIEELQGSYLTIDWAIKPVNVRAYTTLISGGFSSGDYAEFNLASHVDDDLTAVKANRKKLSSDLNLPTEPVWLEQVHGDKVIVADEIDSFLSTGEGSRSIPQADASIARKKGTVCVALTADCLPVFFCNQSGSEVAVAHAGWRGLCAGVIHRTIEKMHSPVEEILISFGPAIGEGAFEVGEEVKQAFTKKDQCYNLAFKPVPDIEQKRYYLCDIYLLARIELQLLGVDPARITGSKYCTYSEANRFYSYRRQKQTGRMANLIWRT